jgi:hypothetical protein
MTAWYRADQGITIATGVSQWSDLSGNARHLLQATGANQPTFTASSINGKPDVAFDGVNDVLGPVSFTQNLPFTRLVAVKNTLGANGTHDIIMDGGTALAAASQVDSTPEWNMFPDSVTYTQAVASGTYAYVMENWDTVAGVGALRVNGTQRQTGGAASVTSAGLTLGASATPSRWTVVSFAEVLVLAGHPNASAANRLENYMKARYGL